MSKKFERLLEKATDPTLLEPDWEGILNCVDSIRSNETAAKTATPIILKRIKNENPHVSHHALLVLESSVKNCGDKMHKTVATRDFMEELKRLAHDSKADKVKEKVLELISVWAHAFKDRAEYKIVTDTHNLMKLEGFEFPSIENLGDAMFSGQSAPDWVDDKHCFRCRTEFGLITRKHHCRSCGQIFCNKCSPHFIPLSHIGIEYDVRVCETCYEKYGTGKETTAPSSKIVQSTRSVTGAGIANERERAKAEAIAKARELEMREKEELDMALAISQSEAEAKEQERQRILYTLYNGSNEQQASEQQQPQQQQPQTDDRSIDPELARYLDRGYWEKKRQTTGSTSTDSKYQTPTAPFAPMSTTSSTPAQTTNGYTPSTPSFEIETPVLNGNTTDDTEKFAWQLKQQIEIFVNRIKSDQARGRPITNDSSIQNLFVTLTTMHTQLLQRMHELDNQRGHFESLQDKISAIGEAREAVDALRDENARIRQQQAWEEQQRRQRQMMLKLDVMRQRKYEMLEQQRHAALERFQQHQMQLHMQRQQNYQMPAHYGMQQQMATSSSMIQQPIYNTVPPPPHQQPDPNVGFNMNQMHQYLSQQQMPQYPAQQYQAPMQQQPYQVNEAQHYPPHTMPQLGQNTQPTPQIQQPQPQYGAPSQSVQQPAPSQPEVGELISFD